MLQNGSLMPGRQWHAGGQPGHVLLRLLGDPLRRVVDGGGDQILEHLLVVAHQRGVDLDPLDLVAAVHGDLHHAAAGLAGDLLLGQLLLGLLHILLHFLGLLDQLAHPPFI